VGGLDYITKPFNPIELASLVRSVVAAVLSGDRETLRAERIAELRSLYESA
jgi:DNA-binding response OmpR family regulator